MRISFSDIMFLVQFMNESIVSGVAYIDMWKRRVNFKQRWKVNSKFSTADQLPLSSVKQKYPSKTILLYT